MRSLGGQLLQLRQRQLFDVRRIIDHIEITAHTDSSGRIDGFQAEFAFGAFLQLLHFQFRLAQFRLAELRQPRAFLVTGQQRFQRQLLGFHRLHDGLEAFERFFEWRVRCFGLGVFRALCL